MKQIKSRLAEELGKILGVEVSEKDIEVPEPEHGDFAYPVMKAASQKGENPRELAEEAAEELEESGLEMVENIQVAGPGYLNVYLDREELGGKILEKLPFRPEEKDEKVIVEHTSPNPNKPLHMGTMRCAILGDSLARVSEFQGYEVEVQDFVNDLGRQSARTVYAYRNFLDELDNKDQEKKADYWIGILYSIAGQHIEENPEEEDKVSSIIQEIEEMDNDTAELKDELVEKSLKGQLQTAYNTNIFYDVVPFERDIVKSDLLEETRKKLEDLDSFYTVEEGEDEGCEVIDLSSYEEQMGGMKKPYKILFRSDGTATYTAKDIAITMWKFGLIDSNFGYRELEEQPNTETLWTTGGTEQKDFGDADRVFNVVGYEQSYVMDVIKYSLDALSYGKASENFTHVDFKFVYLPGKESYSGRKGNWVGKHGDAVLERCQELALEEIQDRYDFTEEKEKEIAEKVGVAAVRYFILKFTREKDIDFSFEKALDWEGDSGPYLLYTVARAYGIKEKTDVEPEFSTYEKDVEYELLRKLSEFEDAVENSFRSQEPAKLAHYIKETAEKFNSFYHSCHVKDADEELKKSRMAIIEGYIEVMEEGLDLLGIEPLEEM